MLKSIAAAIAISLMIGSVPALAKVNCEKLCAVRCQSSAAKSVCRDRCLPACEANHNR
jgi:BarA-like signal transduction histidine kinase